MNKKENILIIGAGLSGSLLALRLAQRGYIVNLRESRPDLRITDISAGRSINLALSNRGINALKMVGILDKVLPLCIPMNGRMIHSVEEETFLSNYSGREGEYINSISREDLNTLLLNEADKFENISITFNNKCKKVDLENNIATFWDYKSESEEKVEATIIFGADGAGSSLRKSMFLKREMLFSYSQQYLKHGYKELSIPPSNNGNFRTFKNALHIWPRGSYMLIALPNLDGSFTVTLFLSHEEEEYNFKDLDSKEKLSTFFRNQFPDAFKLMPNLVEEFFDNPVGNLGTIKCEPWNYKGKTLLIGDAAHAIVPFYGQGMNASFEDVFILDTFIEKYKGDWSKIFFEYEKERKKDTDAIGDLAIENFYEMRDHVANHIFKEKRKIELVLEQKFSYFSKYSMVTFNENISYSDASIIGNAQDKALLNLIADGKLEGLNSEQIFAKVKQETLDIIDDDKVAKTMHH
ncbi:FAD-dependent oxidoreductase [Urechidicola croceus]|uniref:Kynurenine 3-monooxygenase n=1 Tax=Urechidicola croceus TaxID=1850246 RepID=A0A1D8P6V2_9FLAO|nr:NAD(P)/FAD-dependent oxidoreductase [Urechidicola croceus]AOW20282.1 kynurenine 3-monooxygenase [Urechidicola croceus]